MYKMLKLIISLCFLFVLSITTLTIYATANTAGIEVTITKDDAVTKISGFTVTVQNSAEQTLTAGTDYNFETPNTGVYRFTGLSAKEPYFLTFTSGNNSLTVNVPVSTYSNSTRSIKAVWIDSVESNNTKSGVIGGTVVDGSGSALPAAVVKAVSSNYTYSTVTSTQGAYRIYVPAGKYTVVIVGKDAASTDYKNVSSAVTVLPGQLSGPANDLCGKTIWSTDENKMGLTNLSVSSLSKKITGVVAPNTTVSAYVYDSATQRYSFLASVNIGSNKNLSVRPAFTINLSDYPVGRKIAVRVKDAALNMYEDSTFISNPLNKLNMILKEDTTNATFVQPIDITFSDTYQNYAKNITSVTAAYSSVNIQMVRDKDYKIASGKITIASGVLATPQAYTIKVQATGYNDAYVTQTIGISKTSAPPILGKVTVAPGSTIDSTAVAAEKAAASGNIYMYKIGNSAAAVNAFYGNTEEGFSAFASEKTSGDIAPVDASTNRYIGFAEVTTPGGMIVRYNQIKLSTSQIRKPTIISGTADGNKLILFSDTEINTSAPQTDYFTVKVAGSVKKVTGVGISGRRIVLTLESYAVYGQPVWLKYKTPTINPLKDLFGNTMLDFTTDGVLNCTGGPTFVSAVSSTTNAVTITMSKSISGTLGNPNAFVVKKGSTRMTVSSVSISGTNVTITISGTVAAGDSISVDYAPTGLNDLTDGSIKAAIFSTTFVKT